MPVQLLLLLYSFPRRQRVPARPIDDVVREVAAIDNNRLFFVDNSMAPERPVKDLFRALIPLKKSGSHPIKDNDRFWTWRPRQAAGMYQAIFDTSDYIRNWVKRLQERGIGVEDPLSGHG
jgi:hypothetical protein